MFRSCVVASLSLLATIGCMSEEGDDGGGGRGVGGVGGGVSNSGAYCQPLTPRNADEISICNALGEAVLATVAFPEGVPPPGGWPGVLLLHGSGGLHVSNDDGSCGEELEPQFERWAGLLLEQGYAVVMPDSFIGRGFCDWSERSGDADDLDKHDRLVLRSHDAAAAAIYACVDPRINCSRLAALGFSDGASTLLMLFHEDPADCEDERLQALPKVLPPFVGGVAYYPGCGYHGELPTSLDIRDIDRFYYPRAPLWVPHAEDDDMLDNCEAYADPQVDFIAEQRGVHEDMFELRIYEDARHGFDGSAGDDRAADKRASTDAEASALAKLDGWLSG